jgi:hypothetical protein
VDLLQPWAASKRLNTGGDKVGRNHTVGKTQPRDDMEIAQYYPNAQKHGVR